MLQGWSQCKTWLITSILGDWVTEKDEFVKKGHFFLWWEGQLCGISELVYKKECVNWWDEKIIRRRWVLYVQIVKKWGNYTDVDGDSKVKWLYEKKWKWFEQHDFAGIWWEKNDLELWGHVEWIGGGEDGGWWKWCCGGVDFLSSKLEMNQQIKLYSTEVISIYNFFLNSTFHFDVWKHDLKRLVGPCMTWPH